MSAGFHCDVIELDAATILIRVVGDLDLATASGFTAAVEPYAGRQRVIDLSAATFIDSTGLRALLDGGPVRDEVTPLICPPGAARRMLELTGVDRLFEMHASLDDWMDGRSNGYPGPVG